MKRPVVEALRDLWPAGNDYPIVLCDVVGEESSNRDDHSKCNTDEATKVVS